MKFGARLKRMGKRFWISMAVIVVIIIGIRIALPYVLLKVVNDKLANLEGYTGHVEDIDLNLYRGAYVIQGLTIKLVEDSVPVPFVDLREMDISVEWKALLQGSFVAEIVLDELKVNFVSGKKGSTEQTGEGVDWRQQVVDLVPIKINRFEIINSEIHYRDFSREPLVDLYMDRLHVLVTNLTNSTDLSETMVSDLEISAAIMSGAPLSINGKLDPFDSLGTFAFKVELEKLPLTDINNFMQAYAKIDARKGTFSLYSEVVAVKGAFEGYAKPLMHDVEILAVRDQDDSDNFLRVAWEGIVGLTIKILQNQKEDQFATQIPFSGDLSNPKINILRTITNLLRNAFVHALTPSLEGTLSFGELGGKTEGEGDKGFFERRQDRRDERKKNKDK
ncbi:DUF748 domain-containing protein [soil metagenome]